MPERRAAATDRLVALDALRAIAALLVVWMHVSESFYGLSPQTEASRWLYDAAHLLDAGRVGVVAFFVISGFVIPFSVHPERPRAGWDFAIRRVFRIYPAYWLSVAAGAYACHWLWGREFTAGEFLVNLTLLQDLVGVRSAQGLYWTLGVELVFYAVCLVFVLTGSIRNYRRIALFSTTLTLVVAASLVFRAMGRPALGFDVLPWFVYLAIMSMGTLLRAWCDGELRAPAVRACLWGLLAFYLAGLPLLSTLAAKLPWQLTVPYSIGVAVFVLGMTVVRITHPIMAWLGRISYSIYLFHAVVFYPMLWLLLRLPVEAWWRTRHLAFYLALNVILTVAVAAFVHAFVEKPGIRLGRRVAGVLARQRTVARDA